MISQVHIRPRHFLLLINTLLICLFFFSSDVFSQEQMVYNGDISLVQEFTMNLIGGRTYVFETANLSMNADPVLNLLAPGDHYQVAQDDNGGVGNSAKITWVATSSGIFRLILRSKNNGLNGTADLLQDGQIIGSHKRFGGWHITLPHIRKKEMIQTVKLPGDAGGQNFFYILKSDGIGISERVEGGGFGIDKGVWYQSQDDYENVRLIVGSNKSPSSVRLVRNDVALAGHDADGDGLGSELENEIGTCSTLTGFAKGFDCSIAADPKDTDGDGLSDAIEFLGKKVGKSELSLPKWGADPRHKDMFIEVDFMRTKGTENANHLEEHMTPAIARHFAAIYGDTFTTNPLLRLYHAVILRNPDQLPGVTLHLDTGVEPELPGDSTIFGDWKGYNAVSALTKDGSPCSLNTADKDCQGVAPDIDNKAWHTEAWKTNLADIRLGIFRYSIGFTTGGSQCGFHFGCAFNFHDNSNPPHEWGHTLGMGHSGPYDEEKVDVNCKPNYGSIMNYAFIGRNDVGFSDSTGFNPLNNTRLIEWQSVAPTNITYLKILKDQFQYIVDEDHGHVDWNRDGVFQPEGQTVSAYANFRPGESCEFTRYNRLKIGNAQTTTTPVLARLGKRLYIFYARDGALKYRYSTSNWNCSVPGKSGCQGATWGNEMDAGMNSVGVDVTNIGGASNGQIIVVSATWQGKLIEKRLSIIGSTEKWTTSATIGGRIIGEPALSASIQGASYLVYKGPDLTIHFNRLINEVWQADSTALDNTGQPIQVSGEWCSPGLKACYLPWREGQRRLYGFFPDKNGSLDAWCLNTSNGRWEKTDAFATRPGPIHGKPGLAYVPFGKTNAYPGRLYLSYLTRSSGPDYNGNARLMMSYVGYDPHQQFPRGPLTKIEKIGLDSYFDNVWFKAYAMSLFYESGTDINVRAVYANMTDKNEQFQIWFSGNADGINNFTYRNSNDWNTMRNNICNMVVNPGGKVSHPISCPSK